MRCVNGTFIIYGEDGTTYNDDFNSSYDGTYEFKFLQKGKYKVCLEYHIGNCLGPCVGKQDEKDSNKSKRGDQRLRMEGIN